MANRFDELDWLNNDLMICAAHRYCLGRQSYIVSACVEWLNAHWKQFSSKTQNLILRDTMLELMDHHAGSKQYDEPMWRKFCEDKWTHLSKESQQWLVNALAYKQLDWPLSVGGEFWPHNIIHTDGHSNDDDC